jgi:hypothetical protein
MKKQIKELGEISIGCLEKTNECMEKIDQVKEAVASSLESMSFVSEFANIQNCIDLKL